MVAAVRVHKVGGPEVLTYEQVEVPAPGQRPNPRQASMPSRASISSIPISAWACIRRRSDCRLSPETKAPVKSSPSVRA